MKKNSISIIAKAQALTSVTSAMLIPFSIRN